MEEKNDISVKKNFLINVKSKYILKGIMEHISEKKLLNVIQKNKKLQNLLNKDINDYKKYMLIEIEVISGYGNFINISDEKYFNVYLDNNNKAVKKNKLLYKENVGKIKIELCNNITSLAQLFKNCINIMKITFNKFGIKDINNMNKMFDMCINLSTLNFNSFYTEKVTNMQGMFFGCENLTELNLSNFNTANVTDMAHMFYRCINLKKLTISNLITKNVTSMSNMFKGCRSLEKLELSNFDTHNVTDMSYMFALCAELTSLNISSFDTKKVINMNSMFKECKKLKYLDISNFVINDNTDTSEMFYDLPLLSKLILPFHLKDKKKLPDDINKIFYKCNAFRERNVIYKKFGEKNKDCICF